MSALGGNWLSTTEFKVYSSIVSEPAVNGIEEVLCLIFGTVKVIIVYQVVGIAVRRAVLLVLKNKMGRIVGIGLGELQFSFANALIPPSRNPESHAGSGVWRRRERRRGYDRTVEAAQLTVVDVRSHFHANDTSSSGRTYAVVKKDNWPGMTVEKRRWKKASLFAEYVEQVLPTARPKGKSRNIDRSETV